ncbi:hypothetical protein [Maridesulfovibrio hydrothermalis]|uniref:Putative lipoprotein n=1 Tax=Maridesulfovibrio hydrothermalis AM13 = DSM 14728 TaxID=1121451 RepID=L0RGL5_9BACT|nr:hypothetical protein [Maridesulfovibrio hydrothermalis]CCO25360.1 putative lipoprotein [Maridesulfovibrio hydrothermalis AM13 = DSM 14728]
MRFRKNRVYAFLIGLCCLATAGCLHLGVSHLEKQPWKLETTRTMQMEFMKFDYEVVPRKDSFGVRGMAYVKKKNVPIWATWIGELWIQGYLSDQDGAVLAQGLQVFSPQALKEGKGIPFDFELKPDSLDSGQLFVSFGYRMSLSKTKDDNDGPPFMAIERAVSQ